MSKIEQLAQLGSKKKKIFEKMEKNESMIMQNEKSTWRGLIRDIQYHEVDRY